MLKTLNPPGLHPPFARYAHGIAVPAGARLVFCSGQLGISTTAEIPLTVEEQTALCFDAIGAILAEAGMRLADVVRINAFVTGREHLQGYMAVRDRYFADHPPPASTLMIVSGFARMEFMVEIEAMAARV
ncbi:RidA family protein [Lichenihabitans sp. Uapishka_5]|uniref:RidA family protein n=1 Tax=Lichenihabitans sp. Uapishka_5 TaxID=3037302 RepID=UPI0029E7EAAF|nr:RidA family protein [Lichenihabitans sp. Uapishka_5]MDX7949994.1 RidA family protein [Lichenihabitans sp. Uapishka_5]